jgi:hypothetical protein
MRPVDDVLWFLLKLSLSALCFIAAAYLIAFHLNGTIRWRK